MTAIKLTTRSLLTSLAAAVLVFARAHGGAERFPDMTTMRLAVRSTR